MMKNLIRVGVLGAGPLNMIHHIPNFVNIPNCCLEMVCDLDTNRLEECNKTFHPNKITTDYEEMLSNPDIDLICIATNPSLQYNLAKKSIQSGKHTFVEKPMAKNEEECLELAQLAYQHKVQLATGYNRRFSPAYLDLKSIMDNYSTPPIIYYRMVDDYRDGRLKNILMGTNSQLIEETCHIFDVVCWLCNDKPVEVYNMSIPPLSDVVMVRLSKGGVCNIISSAGGTMAWPKEGIEVFLERGAVRIDDFVEMHTANVKGWIDQIKRYPGYECGGEWLKGYANIIASEGLERVLFYRREWQKIWNDEELTKLEDFPVERMKFIESKSKGKLPPVNYMVDKGWRKSDESLIRCLLEGSPFKNAGGVDAAISLACASTSIESGKTGKPIKLNPEKWSIHEKNI